MYKDLENTEYDYLFLGTSLTETALSAYLSKQKSKILQMDISRAYGGDCKSFNLKDMEKFVNEIKNNSTKDSSIKKISLINRELKPDLEPLIEKENFREYNFDLNPKFIYAKSKSCSELIDSKASNYLEFNSVKKIFFMYDDKFLNVPFSKSEIFISNDLTLLEKQKLLNFIFSVMKLKNNNVDVNSTVDIKKDIELDDDYLFKEINKNLNMKAVEFLEKNFNSKIKDMILLILANQTINTLEMTVDQMCDKIYKFLISVQIYDQTPFLIPQFGSSEFSQAMSRLSAVCGSIFLINDYFSCKIKNNEQSEKKKRFHIEVLDNEKKESFNIFSDNLVVNNCYLDDKESQMKFSEDIKIHKDNDNKVIKYMAFYIIKLIGELASEKEGPFYYRIPKMNSILKNEYWFDVIKYFNNTSQVPKNRMLLQIQIFSDMNEKNEDEFIQKCKNISKNFVNKIIEDLKVDILKNYENEEFKSKCTFKHVRIIEEKEKNEEEERKEKEEEEKRKKEEEEQKKKEEEEKKEKKDEGESGKGFYIPPRRERPPPKKEYISLTPETIVIYELKQIIDIGDYIVENENLKKNIIFTKNNFFTIDLDDYFDESFNILKKYDLIKEENKEKEKKPTKKEETEVDDEDEVEDNNLIDELFNEIEMKDKKKKKKEEDTILYLYYSI